MLNTVTLLPAEASEDLSALMAGILVVEMDCQAGDSVDDLVRQDPLLNNAVVTAFDNLVVQPIIGIIKEKITSTTCLVALRGVVDVSFARGRVWLGDDGAFSSTAPAEGYIQTLGYSFGNGKLFLEPNPIVTFKSP